MPILQYSKAAVPGKSIPAYGVTWSIFLIKMSEGFISKEASAVQNWLLFIIFKANLVFKMQLLKWDF